MDNKKFSQFFADELRKKILSEEEVDTLAWVLFPGFGETKSERVRNSSMRMARAFEEWQKTKESEQQEVVPMSDEELEELAKTMY